MKKMILSVCATAILGSLVSVGQAQQAPATPAAPKIGQPAAPGMGMGQPGGPTTRPVMRDRTDMLARMLNLSDEQKEKVRPILEDEAKQMAAIREQTQQKLKTILTPEQWEKYYRPSPAMRPPMGMPGAPAAPGAPVAPPPAAPAPPK